MDSLCISILEHAFISCKPTRSISKKTINSLSKINFDGEGIIFDFVHLRRFNPKCKSFEIYNENELCRLFTLTFQGRIKGWFEMFLAKSIHTWKQFIHLFIVAHRDYNYSKLCLEMESLPRYEGEPFEELFFIFMLIFHKFYEDDQIPGEDALEWFIYLLSLSNQHNQVNNDEIETDFSHDMHVAKDIGSLVNVVSRSNSFESTIDVEIFIQ